MKNSESAFGIYSFKSTPEGKALSYGQGAMLEDYYLNFWKGRYLVTLTGYDEEESTIAGLEIIARAIEQNIDDLGAVPPLVEMIPEEDLIPGSIEYFNGYLSLFNSHRFFEENTLSFEKGVRGDYSRGFSLFIFSYSDPAGSIEVFNKVRSQFKENSDFSPVDTDDADSTSARDKEGSLLTVCPVEGHLIIVRGAENPDEGLKEIQKIRDKLIR